MKILLVGPYPPPHGGVSVHVAGALDHLRRAGIPCRVLNLNRSAPESEQYIRVSNVRDLAAVLLRHARAGWTTHVNTNGHNLKSWLVALLCGVAGRFGAGSLLTLHSGMAPAYLLGGRVWRRSLAWSACMFYSRIICVNREIEETIASLGIARERLAVISAFLPPAPQKLVAPDALQAWIRNHTPLLSTALFYRPEYGFELLMEAVAQLRLRYPNLGCLVMGSGEQETEARNLVRKTGLAANVLLPGDVSHESCLALISLSDIFVRPTLEDGDSISVREAIALGVPVVASDVGARPPEALLFKAGNTEDLVAKIESCLGMAQRGRNQTESPGPYVDRLLEMYTAAVTRENGYGYERRTYARIFRQMTNDK